MSVDAQPVAVFARKRRPVWPAFGAVALLYLGIVLAVWHSTGRVEPLAPVIGRAVLGVAIAGGLMALFQRFRGRADLAPLVLYRDAVVAPNGQRVALDQIKRIRPMRGGVRIDAQRQGDSFTVSGLDDRLATARAILAQVAQQESMDAGTP